MPSTTDATRRPDPARAAARAARTERLLDAAADTIRRRGAATSMDEIAAGAGVAKPILYRYFGDRNGLVAALAARFGAALLSELGRALARQAPPPELIRTTIDAYIGFIEADTELYRFLTQWAHSEQPQAVGGLMAEVSRQIARIIEAHLTSAGLDPSPAQPWAYGLVGMVHLAGDWWIAQGRGVSRSQLVDHLAALQWSGMSGFDRPAAATPPR